MINLKLISRNGKIAIFMQAANLYINRMQQNFNVICICLICIALHRMRGLTFTCSQWRWHHWTQIIGTPFSWTPHMAAWTLELALSIQIFSVKNITCLSNCTKYLFSPKRVHITPKALKAQQIRQSRQLNVYCGISWFGYRCCCLSKLSTENNECWSTSFLKVHKFKSL